MDIGTKCTWDQLMDFKEKEKAVGISFTELEVRMGGYHFTRLVDGKYELSSTPKSRMLNQPKVNIIRKDSALNS